MKPDAATHIRQAYDAVVALAPGQPVPSPCNDVCRIDAASGVCTGCLRTLDEIGVWSSLGDGGKRAVWRLLAQRAAMTL